MSDATAAPVEAAQPVEAVEAVEVPAVAAVEETKAEEKAEEKAEAPAENGDAQKTTTEAAKNGKASRKFDPSVLPESDDHAAIQTQVHFYFSDSNLPTDKFLWELTGGAENKPVELKKICQFGRMRRFKSYETVVAALRDSKFLTISGEPGAEVVVRKNAYNADRPRSKIDAATVYVKGFGDEEPSTQFDLEAFFAQFGSVNAVRLRRDGSNAFKGSVFVEFQDPEQADKFLKLEPAPKWKDQDLKIMSKPAYVAEKSQLIREGKIEPNANSAPRFYEGRTMGGGNRGRGGFRGRGGSGSGNGNGGGSGDKNDWKKRRDDDRKNGFRGGRGGRGGRGRGGGRGGNNNSDNKNRNAERNTERSAQPNGKPVIHSTNDKGEVVENNKRARDDDASSAPPAKKVDVKTDA